MPDAVLPPIPEVAELRTRVGGLERDMAEVKTVVNDGFRLINSKLDAKGQTPWAVIIAALGFLLMFCTTMGVLAYRPIEGAITRLEEAGRVQREATVPRSEHERVWRFQERLGDGLMRRVEGLEERERKR